MIRTHQELTGELWPSYRTGMLSYQSHTEEDRRKGEEENSILLLGSINLVG